MADTDDNQFGEIACPSIALVQQGKCVNASARPMQQQLRRLKMGDPPPYARAVFASAGRTWVDMLSDDDSE